MNIQFKVSNDLASVKMLSISHHLIIDLIADAYLVGFPAWIFLALKISKKYPVPSLISALAIFIVNFVSYIYLLTQTSLAQGKFDEQGLIALLMIIEAAFISMVLFIKSIHSLQDP